MKTPLIVGMRVQLGRGIQFRYEEYLKLGLPKPRTLEDFQYDYLWAAESSPLHDGIFGTIAYCKELKMFHVIFDGVTSATPNLIFGLSGDALPDSLKEVSLCHEIAASSVPWAYHETDLYFKAEEKSLAILAKYPLQKSISTHFTNQCPPNVGERWIDVPFAYLPSWERKLVANRQFHQKP